jgi:hypothetical protein
MKEIWQITFDREYEPGIRFTSGLKLYVALGPDESSAAVAIAKFNSVTKDRLNVKMICDVRYKGKLAE